MEPGTTIFRDIHGLDAIPWWPLAHGWWYLAAMAGVLVLLAGIRYWLFYNAGWLGWRGDARRQLRALRKAVASEDAHAVAGRLSELLRRIALVHSEHREAAGLTGDTWLRWLVEHDNSGFDWQRHGQMLLTLPYMPPTMTVEREELLTLIHAATRWIDAYQSDVQEPNFPQRFKNLLSGIFHKGRAERV